jgi:very-short-patch-repair endonuclease
MPNGSVISNDSEGKTRKLLPDRVIGELADRQYGVVTRAQLLAAGVGAGAVELRLARGRLRRVHAGVYAVGHRVLTREGRWMAAVLAGGRDAVLSHRSAGALWGIQPSQRWPVDVTTRRKLQSRPGIHFHRSRLPPDEVTVHEGIPVTGVTRTLFDLAAAVSIGQLGRAMREVEARRIWDRLSLHDLLARHPRPPGAAAIRALLDDDAYVTRSEFEERLLALVDAAGLQRPLANVTVHLGGRFIEVDFAWPEHRVVVELDGHASHGTRASFEEDRARDRALVAAGWRVIRITWRQLRDEPERIAADLRAALAQAAHR